MNLLGCLALNRGPETGVWYRAIKPQFWQTSLTTAQTKILPSRFNEGRSALFAVSGLEGFLTLSARLPYHKNLAVFPQKLQPGSRIVFDDPATGQQHMIAPATP